MFILIAIILLSEGKKRRSKKKLKIAANDDLPHKADVYPENFIPVPFGHIFKEGFHPSLKMPLDLLELDRRYSKKTDVSEFDKTEKSIQRNPKEKPREMDSPKDLFEIDEEEKLIDDKIYMDGVKDVKNSTQDEIKMWHDLARNHARSLSEPRGISYGRISKDTNSNQAPAYQDNKNKEQFFSKSSFDIEVARRENKLYNWTTCDEFGRNADFHPDDVINIDWVPFYSWSPDEIQRTVSFVHRFSTPTIKVSGY